MINRINLILKAKNITARQFADAIGIQPSGMSHILGGRNNPSLEFVTKVIKRYPEIDANWLLLGRGEMYNGLGASVQIPSGGLSDAGPTHDIQPGREVSLFSDLDSSEESANVVEPDSDAGAGSITEIPAIKEKDQSSSIEVSEEELNPQKGRMENPSTELRSQFACGRHLVRLLMVYDDGTFEECLPAK